MKSWKARTLMGFKRRPRRSIKWVRIEPDCIEIVTSKDGAEQIHLSVKEFNPEPVVDPVHQLSRHAVIGGIEQPLYEEKLLF